MGEGLSVHYSGGSELPEDVEKAQDKQVQDLVNEYNKKIEDMLKEKEEELMSV